MKKFSAGIVLATLVAGTALAQASAAAMTAPH